MATRTVLICDICAAETLPSPDSADEVQDWNWVEVTQLLPRASSPPFEPEINNLCGDCWEKALAAMQKHAAHKTNCSDD